MAKYIAARALTTADQAAYKYTTYFYRCDEDLEYEDLFNPRIWIHHGGTKLKPADVIRVTHPRGIFDVQVTVRSVEAGGVVMDYFGGRPPKGIDPFQVADIERNAAMRIVPCPIARDGLPEVRTNYQHKTKWRVLGLGMEEVKKDFPTEDEAKIYMNIYLNDIRMRLPTAEEILAEQTIRQAAAEARDAAVAPKPAKTPNKPQDQPSA